MQDRDRTENPNRLLVADIGGEDRDQLVQAGERLGFAVVTVANDAAFRNEVARWNPTVIALDPLALGSSDGELFQWLGGRSCPAALIVAGGEDAAAAYSRQEQGLRQGLNLTLSLRKPWTPEALDAALRPLWVEHYALSEAELRRAIDRAQLRVHYQPKLRATAGSWEVAGIEALLRWEHPDYGLIFPAQFIGLAERHGLISALTDYVLQTGIEQLSAWNQTGPSLNLSVNLSPALVTDGEFPERLTSFLRSQNVAPAQLTIEITELGAMANTAPTGDVLARLRATGIGLSLDDFGTGHSSLTQLYRLPFNEVKIDRTIGRELPDTNAVRMIVRAIIELGHNLDLHVCCEGVENESALEFLHQAGCDFAQGYFIARPMPAEELAKWLGESNPWCGAGLRRAS
jgi:EAL domain-containing protein (putative c-di-GMP-specific phosphodiesterase class I)